jgi:anaerobic magnesium-protoporphyrin IX monomethyl ester cyclase
MARVLLISPFDELCKGLRYVAASLHQAGHPVEILALKVHKDCTIPTEPRSDEGYYGELFYASQEELHLLLEEIKRFDPALIGISVFSHYTGVVEWLTQHIRRQSPSIPILWGGVDVTYNPDRAIQAADIICLGEGEEAIVELVEALERDKDPTQIRNFWFRRNGEIIKQPMRPLVEDIDQLPIPLYDVAYTRIIRANRLMNFDTSDPDYLLPYVLSTRGCPSACTYCYNAPFRDMFKGQRFIRSNSVDRVIAEIRTLLKAYPGLPFLKFADDVFGYNWEWTEKFKEQYQKEIAIPFRNYLHPTVSKFPLLKLLKEAGMDVAVMGVQTGSRRILKDVYRRPFYSESVLDKLCELRELDVWAVVDLILFNPFEEEADLRETFQLVYDFPKPIGFPFLGNLMLFENFPITIMAKERGYPLRRLDNSNTYFSNKDIQLNNYYKALFGLASLETFPRRLLKRIFDKKLFFDDPSELLELMNAYLARETVFVHELWINKDNMLRDLESELKRIKGSRLHRAADKLGKFRSKMLG